MLWVLIWAVLLLGAALVIGLLARMLWHKAKALTTELGDASERLTAVLDALNDLTDRAEQPEAARAQVGEGVIGGRARTEAREVVPSAATDLDGVETMQ